MLSIIIGVILFLCFRYQLLSGLGAAATFMSVYGYYQYMYGEPAKENQIENLFVYLLFFLVLTGLLMFVINHWLDGPPFVTGAGIAICFYAGMMYAVQLYKNFMVSIK